MTTGKTFLQPNIITATPLQEEEYHDFWSRYFGHIRQWEFLEPQIFSLFDRWCPDYCGGRWHFYTLSNGGIFLVPPACDSYTPAHEHYELFSGEHNLRIRLSTEACGIAVCLSVWRHHAHRTGCDAMMQHFYRLLDYALQYPEPEYGAIMRIIR
ncbi:TPA: antirestriction protein [Salmonella enterica]|nr:antirestriction protein [Salmonella enterica]